MPLTTKLAIKAAKILILVVGLIWDTKISAAGQVVPMPQPRPPALDQGSWPVKQQSQLRAQRDQLPANDASNQGCLAHLQALDIRFDRPAMAVTNSLGCLIQEPVRLHAIPARSRVVGSIRLPEGPTVSCAFAERFSDWLGNLVSPLIAGRLNAEIKAVHTGAGFECRNRNGLPTGKLSEHALGTAIDIASFELSNGTSILIKSNEDDETQQTLRIVRTAACGWFTTVLGPGSDAFHVDHLHLDILRHGMSDRYRICQ
jgi:hypothetical protein